VLLYGPPGTGTTLIAEAASDMSDVVANSPSTAAQELDNAPSTVTEYARNTPDRYVAADRFDNK
jgi:SpoVK/Ycf46/Vps4 family AAA+-type ATPase